MTARVKIKRAAAIFAMLLVCALLASCSSEFSADNEIMVISREEGSGTRGAFTEIFGIIDSNKRDLTTIEAQITNSTSVMMATVAGSKYAIGYISLGSLNDTVKALEIDGAAASAENVKNGTYKVSRPFIIAVKEGVSAAARDFMSFITSDEGQAVVTETGYIAIESTGAYTASGDFSGSKITVAGSSSVTPVMEKLREAYIALNPGVAVEVQQSDSTNGMNSAIEGVSDIGMSSRNVKDSELENGLVPTVIAIDGIAVVVNNDNPADGISSEGVNKIFTGEITVWNELTPQ